MAQPRQYSPEQIKAFAEKYKPRDPLIIKHEIAPDATVGSIIKDVANEMRELAMDLQDINPCFIDTRGVELKAERDFRDSSNVANLSLLLALGANQVEVMFGQLQELVEGFGGDDDKVEESIASIHVLFLNVQTARHKFHTKVQIEFSELIKSLGSGTQPHESPHIVDWDDDISDIYKVHRIRQVEAAGRYWKFKNHPKSESSEGVETCFAAEFLIPMQKLFHGTGCSLLDDWVLIGEWVLVNGNNGDSIYMVCKHRKGRIVWNGICSPPIEQQGKIEWMAKGAVNPTNNKQVIIAKTAIVAHIPPVPGETNCHFNVPSLLILHTKTMLGKVLEFTQV